MAGMISLTQLHTSHDVNAAPMDFQWIHYLHLFPSLSSLQLAGGKCSVSIRLLESIAQAPMLTELTLRDFLTWDLEGLAHSIRQRQEASDIPPRSLDPTAESQIEVDASSSSSAFLLHTLRLALSSSTDFGPLHAMITDLAHLPSLTHHAIERWWNEEEEDEEEEQEAQRRSINAGAGRLLSSDRCEKFIYDVPRGSALLAASRNRRRSSPPDG
jgi:hypothetical protein